MKKQLLSEEFKRMQKLAGLITENQVNEEEISPEQAAKEAINIADELESSPTIDKIAMDIAKDPKATKQLMDLLSKQGINPSSLNENVDDLAVQKLALAFAKKASQMSETISEEEGGYDYGSAFWLGLVGGGTLAHYLFRKETLDVVGLVQHSAAMGPTMAGAIAGALLLVVGKKVYDSIKN